MWRLTATAPAEGMETIVKFANTLRTANLEPRPHVEVGRGGRVVVTQLTSTAVLPMMAACLKAEAQGVYVMPEPAPTGLPHVGVKGDLPAQAPSPAQHRWLPTVVHVLKAEVGHDRMDCEDDDPRKVWVVVGAWSFRRAVLTHAAPFLEAAGTDDLAALDGQGFLCRLNLAEPPPYENEGGERLDWPDLQPTPPMSEVYARLGIAPPADADG